MTHLITYSDLNMTISAMKCRESSLKYGVDEANIYGSFDIDPDFKLVNKEIFSQERGAGCYWIFKPYIIYRKLNELSEGDILIYCDAGCEFVSHVQPIIDRMDEDIFFFTNTFKNAEWSKMDVLASIIPAKWNMEQRQVQASLMFFKVNQKTRDFVKEWLLWCQMPGLIDDSPSKLPNVSTFAEDRHDQSILTALQIKYGYKLHWFPTTTAQHLREHSPEDTYPTLIFHHRRRNNEWT